MFKIRDMSGAAQESSGVGERVRGCMQLHVGRGEDFVGTLKV